MGSAESRSRPVHGSALKVVDNGDSNYRDASKPVVCCCFQRKRPDIGSVSEAYSAAALSSSEGGNAESKEIRPSMGAATVVGNWKHGSVRKDKLTTKNSSGSTGVNSVSDDSFMDNRSEYNLSDQSHEVLLQIIRCFPFPSPRNSPRPATKKPIGRTVSNDPTLYQPESRPESSFNNSTPVRQKKPFGSFLQRVTQEAPECFNSTTSICADGNDDTRGALGRLCQVSVDTMAITALPLDCWLKERLKNWVQLSGHSGTIIPASNHTLWKKQPVNNNNEAVAYANIMDDCTLRGFTPKFFKEIVHNNDSFIEIQDLLSQFPNTSERSVMDIKIGFRTFLESEVTNATKRKDLFKKMSEIDPNEPTDEERTDAAITKLRYMQFRERESSTATLGFRIEAAQSPGGKLQKSFQKIRTKDQVLETLNQFFGVRSAQIKAQLGNRLREMRSGIEQSAFFRNHEVIGSSILVVFDDVRTGAWMIDFAKSTKVPDGIILDHRRPWEFGNHEDGYLFGLDNLISVLEK